MPQGSGLKRKVGPLPVYGWVGAVALGLVWLWWRKTHPSQPAAPPDTSSSQDVAPALPGAPGEPGPTPDVSTELSDLLSLWKFGAFIAQQSQPPAPRVVHHCPRGFSWHRGKHGKGGQCRPNQKVCPPGWHYSQEHGRCVRQHRRHRGGGTGSGTHGHGKHHGHHGHHHYGAGR